MLSLCLNKNSMAQGLKYGTYYSGSANRRASSVRLYVIVGIVAAILLGAGMLLLTIASGNAKADLNLLAARENSLLTLATASQKNINNPDLATANSNASILLTSDVATILDATGTSKLDANLVKQEADTNGDKLKQASLLAKFDSSYRQIVIDKVAALITQATKLISQSSGKTKTSLDRVLTNLNSISKQFTQLSL
jgi:hypothetical protein